MIQEFIVMVRVLTIFFMLCNIFLEFTLSFIVCISYFVNPLLPLLLPLVTTSLSFDSSLLDHELVVLIFDSYLPPSHTVWCIYLYKQRASGVMVRALVSELNVLGLAAMNSSY